MVKITADQIRKLRDESGAPVMRVKKVLEEMGGDEKKALVILKKEGFKVLEVSKSSNVFPLFYLIKSFFVVLNLEKIKLPSFPSLILPIKLGNIVTIARKVK